MAWGGKRFGAGRPKKNKSDVRPIHSIRATGDEWAVIKPFADFVKMSMLCRLYADDSLKRLAKKLNEIGEINLESD